MFIRTFRDPAYLTAAEAYQARWPLGEGGAINDELSADGDDVPLPPWDGFEDADLLALTDELRDAFRARHSAARGRGLRPAAPA